MPKVSGAGDAEGRIRELEERLARETSARQNLEEALLRSEAQFRMMSANLSEIVLSYDTERRLTFVNPAVQALTGYSAADLRQTQFIDWIHPQDRARMLGYWDRLFAGTAYQDEEYRLITRDGRVKWMSASWGPILDESGRQVGVQGREREVTERHMTEETLRLREQRYRALFEGSPFPMWEEDFSEVKKFVDQLIAAGVTDLCRYLLSHREDAAECVRRIRVLDVNRSAREFYGATREQLMVDLTPIFDDAAYDVFCHEIAALASGKSTFKTEFDTHTKRAGLRTVNMIVSLEAESPDWSRAIVSFFDITDRKQLEQELLHSQKLESLGRLAGGVAHDFNNLLMVIAGYSDLLLADAGLREPVHASLREIRRASERGAELTQQLLTFSRKQSGTPKVMDLNELIRESLPMLQRVLGADIDLDVRLEASAWNIRADCGQLHQVLMNLVMNAHEAMPGGGRLVISTENMSAPDGDNLMLQVRDTGRGMDERTRQHLFEPFFTTKRGSTGTGLGLATVFAVVMQAGGHISVNSEPEKGATLSLYFPRAQAPLNPAEQLTEAPEANTESGTVLVVVEDQADVRRLACKILQQMGFTVLEAANGVQALSAVEHFRGSIRLMLTDVIMPEMNGKELADRIAELRPETRVVFMSGYTDRVLGNNPVLDEATLFLQKPFHPDALNAIIRRALG